MSNDVDERSRSVCIFHAATTNDPTELEAAVQAGQTLNDVQDKNSGRTALHLACIHQSEAFLQLAMTMEFDPWVRDMSQRLAADYARIKDLPEIQTLLIDKMYPPGWHEKPDPSP